MGFLTNYISTKAQELHQAGMQLMAKWDPESVGEAQLAEWDSQAKEMAATAAKAQSDAQESRKVANNIRANLERYTNAATKLIEAGNETAANQAADKALEFKAQLESADAEAQDAEAWAAETLEAAQNAQRLVMEGRTKIEQAKRDQARALKEQEVAERRRQDRERMAGISKSVSGADVAINAMAANARQAREKATADRIRGDVLGKATETDAAINAALAEVDGKPKTQSLADKLAALKG